MLERRFRIERSTMETLPYRLVLGWKNPNGDGYDEISYHLTESELKNLVEAIHPIPHVTDNH